MNKKKYIIFTLIPFLFCIDKVNANTCNMKIIKEFNKVSNIYKIDYKYNIEKESYTIILKYSANSIYEYLIYNTDKLECEQINSKTKECHGFKPGKYNYEIYGKNNECEETVTTGNFEIKELKNYSEDPLCEGIEEFVLCQKDYYKELEYETFVSRVNSYKKTKKEKEEKQKLEQEEKEKDELKNKVLTYIENNIIQIVIVVIFIIIVTISAIVMIKSARKSRRLE